MRTADFHYDLPTDRIAQRPIEPRDEARLLDTRTLTDGVFRDLPELLDPGDLLVVNRTRVRRARLVGAKEGTGGRVEALLLTPLGDGRWEALVRPARRLRRGSRLVFRGLEGEITAGPTDGRVVIMFDGDVEAAAEADGAVPLPPYIHEDLADPERYQTVYAERIGSAAAPTAGLHFTDALLARLAERGIGFASVDLEVGLDTFRPIATPEIESHRMHSERVDVPEATVAAIAATRGSGRRVAAVGTTVVRSLETAALGGAPQPFRGPTDLFITPGFEFRVVDLLITNYHAPATSLLVLLAAFMGQRWRTAYAAALDRGYRFLSFGDAMLAERA